MDSNKRCHHTTQTSVPYAGKEGRLPKPLEMLTLDPVSVQVHARELRKVPESRGYGACSKCRQEEGGGLFFAELESTLVVRNGPTLRPSSPIPNPPLVLKLAF